MSLIVLGRKHTVIEPFNPTCVEGEVSYRLHLEELTHFDLNSMGNYDGVGFHFDARKQCKTIPVRKTGDGWLLQPTELYQVMLKEKVGSKLYVPEIQLDPSLSALGITAHNAGFMEKGLAVPVLTISATHLVKIYPGDVFARVFFHCVKWG